LVFFKSNIFFFFFFFAINLILKLIFIDHYSYSYDEIISAGATQDDFGHVKHQSEWDNNPPFYYYCLWVWVRIFPLNEFYTRLLSVLFISIAIGLNFILIRKNLNLFTAVITCVFLSLSNLITFYAHDSRTYSLVLLLSVISSLLFFNFFKKPSYLNLFLLALVNFLIVYSHYIAALLIIGQYIYVMFFEKKQYLKIFVYHTLIIITFVFIRFTKKQFMIIFNFNSSGDFWLKTATFKDLTHSLTEMFFSEPYFLLYFIASIISFFVLYKQIDSVNKRFLFYCLIVGHFAILFLYVLGTFKSVFLSRYLLFTIPFCISFTVFCVFRIKKIGYILSSLMLIIPLGIINIKPLKGMDYKPITEIVKRLENEESCILINTRDNVNLFYYYYDYNNFIKYKKHDSLFVKNKMFGVNDTNQIKTLNLEHFKTIFLVQTFNKKSEGKDIVRNYLGRFYKEKFYTDKYNATEFTIYKKL
jgi:uncharacterized membrane protein